MLDLKSERCCFVNSCLTEEFTCKFYALLSRLLLNQILLSLRTINFNQDLLSSFDNSFVYTTGKGVTLYIYIYIYTRIINCTGTFGVLEEGVIFITKVKPQNLCYSNFGTFNLWSMYFTSLLFQYLNCHFYKL